MLGILPKDAGIANGLPRKDTRVITFLFPLQKNQRTNTRRSCNRPPDKNTAKWHESKPKKRKNRRMGTKFPKMYKNLEKNGKKLAVPYKICYTNG